MNGAAERLLGVSEREYAGMSPREREQAVRIETPAGEPVPAAETAVARALRGEVVADLRETIRRRDGSTVELLASAAPIRDQGGHILGAVRTLADMTAIIRLERQREALVRAVSHDLQSPLASIEAQAQALEQRLAQGAPLEVRAGMAAIVACARRASTMSGDLVDLAHSEAGVLPLSRQPVDLAAFAQQLKAEQAGALDTARIVLEPAPGPAAVSADPDRLAPNVTLSSGVVYTVYATGLVDGTPPLQAVMAVESVEGQPVPAG